MTLVRGGRDVSPYYEAHGHRGVQGLHRPARATARCKGDPSGHAVVHVPLLGGCSASEDPESLVWGACWHPVVERDRAPSRARRACSRSSTRRLRRASRPPTSAASRSRAARRRARTATAQPTALPSRRRPVLTRPRPRRRLQSRPRSGRLAPESAMTHRTPTRRPGGRGLPHRGAARARRHGRGPSRARRAARPPGRAQAARAGVAGDERARAAAARVAARRRRWTTRT